MVVDIELKREKSYNVISTQYVGAYTGENMLRKEFNLLVKWAKKNHVKLGKWFFTEIDGPDTVEDKRRWEASIEVKGKLTAQLPEEIVQKKISAQLVASVVFDPDEFSSRLVYHGLECWLDWRKKYHELEEDGPTREVYVDNPWTSKKAWSNLDVQVPVKRVKKQ